MFLVFCLQSWAAIPEGHVPVASAPCEHEECGIVALPAQRHQDCIWVELGHGEILSMRLNVTAMNLDFILSPWWFQFVVLFFSSVIFIFSLLVSPFRFRVSLHQSGSTSSITWSPRWPTFCQTAKRARCSRRPKDESSRRTFSRPSNTARTCCSTWRPVSEDGRAHTRIHLVNLLLTSDQSNWCK